ncbi:hypothetical protein ACFXJ5_27385 [Streptomyces sp. NPDC059373]
MLSVAGAMICRVGVLYGYYAAADDRDAVSAVVRADGQPSGTGFDQLVIKGIDPAIELLPAEALVTGRDHDEVTADPRRCALIGMVGDGEVVAVSLTDTFRDELACFDKTLLHDVAVGWARSPQAFYGTPDPDPHILADFLSDLAGLATRARTAGHRLYCWICP